MKMTNQRLQNSIVRRLFIANILFFSSYLTAIAAAKTPAFFAFRSTDSTQLDTILTQFDKANGLKDVLEKAKAFEKLGQVCYEDYAAYSIRFFDSAQIHYKTLNKTKERALCLQNMAFTYTEKLQNLEKGLEYSLSVIPLWQSIKSVRDEGNILKFIGFIYGEKEQYDSAFANINRAIEKFESIGFKQGIAVSHFNVAQVFKKQLKTDSCVFYLLKAKEAWVGFKTPSRVFNINNALLNVYLGDKNVDKTNALITENEGLFSEDSDKRIYWRDVEAFYNFCIGYYTKTNNSWLRVLYENKQKKYLEAVKNK
jgi:tetratricopeptide (TPR) repeat protein